MTPRPVIVDTNVLVAGLLTGNPASPVARVVDGMLASTWPVVLSEALLAEYRAVLLRPSLRRQHGLSTDEVDELLTAMVQHAIVLQPCAGPRAPDPGDQMLWDLLAVRDDLRLVTGDLALLQDPAMAGRVLTARDLVGD